VVSRIHEVEQLKSIVPGIEAMTLVSNHHFPRHSHDQFGIGVIAFGAHRSWSAVGAVNALAGDVIMVNPGEIHDGAPLDANVRGWRMVYIDPALLAHEINEEVAGGPIEIVRPVARDPVLAGIFARLFACLATPQSVRLAIDESLLRTLMCSVERHGNVRLFSRGRSPTVAKAVQRLVAVPEQPVSLVKLATLAGVSRFQLLRGFKRDMGITPHAYLIQRRARLARRLLADGRAPAEAAIQAGFADQSHMTRALVRQFGITPGRYQAAIL
jgi:AraC-like DNA-binding protein